LERTGHSPFQCHSQLAVWADSPIGDRYSILPVPLVLADQEYCETIARGVRQRALAMQSLFYDFLTGVERVRREAPLPSDLLPSIFEQEGIDLRALAAWWAGKDREFVRFVYGPDLVRGPQGHWLVIEDNIGCVGGIVDCQVAVERFLAGTGTRLHPAIANGTGLASAVCEFLARAGRTPASPDVMALLGDACSSSDPEASRKRAVLSALGMQVLDRAQVEEARRDGLSARTPGAIVNFNMTGWSPASELADEVFGRRSVPLMTAPGVTALGNKALLPFMDEIVAFYSGEAPALRTAETRLCDCVPDDPDGWVLKRSSGCQGTDVVFLDGMSAAERLALEATVTSAQPALAILQRRVDASFLPIPFGGEPQHFQVELRPFAFVIGDSHCIAGGVPSGRAFRNADGRGLGNMSRGARYLSVIREPSPKHDETVGSVDHRKEVVRG
jgi:uncharacterized circularly permuted ATP-grasp superfamily protein